MLSDIVTDPRSDKIFAVFAAKQRAPVETENVRHQLETSSLDNGKDRLLVRFMTAALAKKDKASIPPVSISHSATIKQLHELAARHVSLPAVFENEKIDNECNCNLAKQISEGSSSTKQVFLVHGKSIVKRIDLDNATETAVDIAIQSELGHTVFAEKKITRHSGESQSGNYSRLPVVAICSKARHTPRHARVADDEDEDVHHTFRLVDLHTSEQPISAASMGTKLSDAALGDLIVDGVLDIYVVNRATSGSAANNIGRSAIFRARPHWEPTVTQTDRGVAMFLSSLRVFASLVPNKNSDPRMKDAVLHVADLIMHFPPCTRALFLLLEGKTLTPSESAAISHAVYETLHDILMPTGIIGTNTDRVFEGARLLFGFILEKARTLKLSPSTADEDSLPYLASFEVIDVKGLITAEPVFDSVRTTAGLLERSLFVAFDQGGVLSESHLQPRLAEMESLASTQRHVILAGGSSPDIAVFNTRRLTLDYRYPDAGNIEAGIDTSELSQLSHLAEVAARNQLSVHRPAQLASAVAPCLTFDRSAHLAVYTGQQACGGPGDSHLVFRPMHGESTMNATVVEQLIAPIIKRYEADGSVVFDSYGGAVLRRLQAPDEILFFCVDTSASMRNATDFEEVNEQAPRFEKDLTADSIVEVEHYVKATFDEMKDFLGKYEGFQDMLAIVSIPVRHDDAWVQRAVASDTLSLVRELLGNEIVTKHERLQRDRDNARSYYARQAVTEATSSLKRLKLLWAGLKTHEEALLDFLIYRAATSPDVNTDWQVSLAGRRHDVSLSSHPLWC